MLECISFDEAIERADDVDRNLLIGNGFSAQYFTYSSLLETPPIPENLLIQNLFRQLNTDDFECVIAMLEDAARVADAYNCDEHSERLRTDAVSVRQTLVNAIRHNHPRNRFDLNYDSPTAFIQNFNKIFSLNYDLLLYWVILELGRRFTDGFGLGRGANGFHGPFDKTAYCDIFNLHGGLHLFQRPSDGEIEKCISDGGNILDNVTNAIEMDNRFPIYVAEGNSMAKMRKINSNTYLRHCYEKLKCSTGTLFIYGHSASENDSHIYRAVFNSEITHVFFSVYEPDDEKLQNFDRLMEDFRRCGRENINCTFFDAASANVWGA